jgi:hypothetical protein
VALLALITLLTALLLMAAGPKPGGGGPWMD